MAPGSEKGHEEHLTLLDTPLARVSKGANCTESNLRVKIPQSLPHVREFRRSDEVVVEVLNHDTGKLDIFFLFKAVR